MDRQGTTSNPGDEPSEERVALVAGLFSQLARTLLAFKLYAPANQLRLEMFDELMRRADALFESEEVVAVEIEPNRLVWLGEPVFEARDAENHFVFNLYKDGARQLALRRGITGQQMAHLLDIVQVRPQALDPTYSVVDALWEAELEHVSHLAVDGFTELLQGESGERPAVGATLANRFERLITDLVGRPAPASRNDEAGRIEAPSAPAELPPEAPDETLIRVSETIASPLKALLQQPRSIEEATAERWVQEATRREDDLLATVEELVLYWLERLDGPFSDEELTELVNQLLRHWMARGNFAVASELLTRMKHLRFELPERAELASAVLASSSGPALRDLLLADDALEGAVWDLSEAVQFFDRHLIVDDDELLELLALDLNRKSRRLLGQMVAQRVAERPGLWAERVTEFPAEVAAMSLASLAALYRDQPDVLRVFEVAFEHEEEQVQLAALRCYPGPYHAGLRARLLPLIDSESMEVRCEVTEHLGRSGDGSLGPFLINRMRREGLIGLAPDEAEALTRAILHLGAGRYTAFVRGQLEQVGTLKGRDPNEVAGQVRAVLSALATMRDAAPIELLRDVRARSRGHLREWCDELWRTVVADWLPDDGALPDEVARTISGEHETLGPTPMSPMPTTDMSAATPHRPLPEEAPDDVESLDDALVTFLDEVEP